MGKLVQFWRKDIINKLILLVLMVILVALGVQVYLLVGTPAGKTFLHNILPTPTLSVDEVFRSGAATITAEAASTQTAIIPTITTLPFTPRVTPPPPSETPTLTKTRPPATPLPKTSTATPTPTMTLQGTPSRTPLAASGSCLPEKEAQAGTVVDIVNGNTVRVLIGDLVYAVRYIGVVAPEDPNFAQLSSYQNSQLVYLKKVKLYAEDKDKDESNRLLRYVVVGDSLLVNQELIRLGVATAATSTYGCSIEFSAAEQDARANHVGMWKANQP